MAQKAAGPCRRWAKRLAPWIPVWASVVMGGTAGLGFGCNPVAPGIAVGLSAFVVVFSVYLWGFTAFIALLEFVIPRLPKRLKLSKASVSDPPPPMARRLCVVWVAVAAPCAVVVLLAPRLGDNSLLHFASITQSHCLLRAALALGSDPNAPEPFVGATPLYMAALDDDAEAVSLLLAYGADCRPGGRARQTPLHAAAGQGSAATVRVLLEAGADPKVRTSSGSSALHLAAAQNHADIVGLLLAQGAFVNALDGEGRTPLDRAVQRRAWEATNALIEAGGRTARLIPSR